MPNVSISTQDQNVLSIRLSTVAYILQAIWQHGARLPKPELQTQPGYEENHSNET